MIPTSVGFDGHARWGLVTRVISVLPEVLGGAYPP